MPEDETYNGLSMEDAQKRIVAFAHNKGEFETLHDGYQYYWPSAAGGGAFSSWMLRALADELDRLNADWDKQVREYFDRHQKEATKDSEDKDVQD